MQELGRGGRDRNSTSVGLLLAESPFFDEAPTEVQVAIKTESPAVELAPNVAAPSSVASSSSTTQGQSTASGAAEPHPKRRALGDATNIPKQAKQQPAKQENAGESWKLVTTMPKGAYKPGDKRTRDAPLSLSEAAMLDFINARPDSPRPDCRRKPFNKYYGNDKLGTHSLVSP